MTAFLRRTAIGAAVALTLGLAAGSAQAGVAMPATGAAAPDVSGITQDVRWVCNPWRCWWRPNAPAFWVTPRWAGGWGPPVRPACYWRRPWGGGWVQVCP